MAIDSILGARKAGLARLKTHSDVTALVAASSIYPQAPSARPAWPFIRWGSPAAVPRRATCLDAAEITVAIHGFAKPREVGGKVVESAEDHAARIGSAIARALDGFYGELPNGTARFQWAGSQLLQDGAEADAFHIVVNFRIRCSTL